MLYPVLTQSRLLSDLSGVWNFKLDNGKGFEEKWYEKPLKDADTMPVPASYNDLKEGTDFRDHYGWVFYQRNISVPEYVKSQRIVLRCAAVTHYAMIYLNGKLICEHKGGFLPFEVELNDHLQDGDNLLTIAVNNVIDYTTLPVGGKANMMSGMMGGMGAGASDKPQNNPNFDFFNYCGITRPVKIYTTPETYINDITVTADIDFTKEEPSAVLNYNVEIKGKDYNNITCKVELFDEEGTKLSETEGSEGTFEISNVRLWQPLNAYLYKIKVTAGQDVYTLPYGVRSVRVDGTKFLINEKPFYFKGYGKHEDTFPNGRGINLPMNTKDISIMKWQHANSFRTSHYPYSEEMMRLCDEEGIVVIDETTAVGVNLQFGGGANFGGERIGTFDKEHGVQTQEHHKDVIRDLISRDKNHACVIGWSLGNECGNGKVFHDEYRRLKEYDPGRFVQFEQAWEDWNTDIVCPMYPNMWKITEYAKSGKQRPFIMCEYAHAQGNSNGNFKDLWDVIYDSPNLQGGFIWDFMDQGFKMKTEPGDGRIYWTYNGKMGSYKWLEDRKGELNTGTDGLISANGIPKPQAYEVKKVYQYIQFNAKDLSKGIVSIRNRYDFTNLNEYAFTWEVYKNGEKFSTGNFNVELKPHAEKEVRLNLPVIPEDGNEYFLNLYAYTKVATDLIPVHYEVAKEQIKLNRGSFFASLSACSGKLSYETKDNVLSFQSDAVSGKIDLKKGVLFNYSINGKQPIKQYPEPAFWRAPVDNDFGNKMPWLAGVWRTAHVNRYVKNVVIEEKNEKGLSIKIDWILSDIQVPYTIEYLIRNNASIIVTGSIDLTGTRLPELPRFGMRMELQQPYENLTYYGRGPFENYIDRYSSSFIGRYEDKVDNQFYWYIRPQETGNKTDVRWLALLNSEGEGVKITGLQPIAFSALHFSPEDLDPGLTRKLQHTIDIVPQKNIFLHVDLKQRGLGGDNSWGMYPHNKYRLLDKKYVYSYMIELID